ncbi:cyclic peptide export ABC transporter [Pseudoalteromonas sp. SMS1]|uniref:cyclic peptide export ABC transporter n=1 Tax=Pseudoalteromonas sp. SMS1 TaxID=2908894 RepID=UPI001F29F1AC|nr:cyclic peptide export ABC transporter [Pseudoalteromonas sp. SMS1]MCF2857588.1 cyclic peptide export ABC transporter [Pseudoalteromonas sp. SMS1]
MNSTNYLTLRRLLLSGSPKKLCLAVILSVLSGALYALIIPTILSGLSDDHQFILGDEHKEHVQTWFFLLIFCVLLTKASSVILVNNLAKTAVAKLRIDLSKKINAMEVSQVEKMGLPKMLNMLTEDMSRITGAALAVPMVLVSGVTALGMLAYLSILDFKIFMFTILGIVVGLFLFQFPVSRTKKYYSKSRDLKDTMQNGFRGLIYGVYELKLNKDKSTRFLEKEISKPTVESLKNEKKGDFIIHIAGNASEILCFFAIGMVVFLLPKGADFQHQNLYGVVMALLYITGPIASILDLMQRLKFGEISINKINELYAIDVSEYQSKVQINKDWKHLNLKNIKYSYESSDHSFSIGTIDLTIRRGETCFVVGGNGSGKSTLSKVVSLHYLPNEGHVLFDDQVVDKDSITSARERLFVIYSDYFLFNTVYKELTEKDLSLIDKYLKLFNLSGKTQLIGNDFTTVKLSDGQRRRLALIVALVEDRDIYILDEWAADQDPEFKDLYYRFVLPDLKQRGKTVIAITHDDRYFDCCDRVIKMENGSILENFEPIKLEAG